MKYAKPELEIIELNMVDVIQTSAGGENENPDTEDQKTEDPVVGGNGTPII